MKGQGILIFAVLIGALAAPGCVPTVSLHSYREVALTITHRDSNEPVADAPFRVCYWYEALTPVVCHVELRTPETVRSKTNAQGKAIVSLADYPWDIGLFVDDPGQGGEREEVFFSLDKELIRKGGVAESGTTPVLKVELCPVAKH